MRDHLIIANLPGHRGRGTQGGREGNTGGGGTRTGGTQGGKRAGRVQKLGRWAREVARERGRRCKVASSRFM